MGKDFTEKPIAYLVHGFNVRDKGAGTTDRLIPYLEGQGFEVREFDYLWTGVLAVRLCNKSKAYILYQMAMRNPGSIAIGHSNGCAIISQASAFGAPFRAVFYINPALNKTTRLAEQIRTSVVYHCPTDRVVWWSMWLIKHSWGEMGRTGYKGDDPRYLNVDTSRVPEEVRVEGHSDIFSDEKVTFWGEKIAKTAKSILEV